MKALYFEDDLDKYLEVSGLLEQIHVQVVWATNLKEGLQKLDTAEPFDLIITDMQFPLTSVTASFSDSAGVQVLMAVRERRLQIPVILCSSVNYDLAGTYGNVWYSKLRPWKAELADLVRSLKPQ